jgi:hypothetical protein
MTMMITLCVVMTMMIALCVVMTMMITLDIVYRINFPKHNFSKTEYRRRGLSEGSS